MRPTQNRSLHHNNEPRSTIFKVLQALASARCMLLMCVTFAGAAFVSPANAIPYEACKAGYKGVGPVCWEACPAGYKDDGATCRKDPVIKKKASYGRGVGKTKDYETCRSGFNGVGPVCWQNCPSGFRNDGGFCKKPDGYDRGVGRTSKKKCEQKHGAGNCEKEKPLWYKKCRAGFHGVMTRCTPICPSGMKDIGVSCTKQSHTRAKANSCPAGHEQDGGLCYPQCKAGYNGVGPVCWEKCPAGTTNDGATCRTKGNIIAKKSYTRAIDHLQRSPSDPVRKMLTGVQPIDQARLVDDCESRKDCVKTCKSQKCRTECRRDCTLEGCGPIATAMLLSYWQGKGYPKAISDANYDGTQKPEATIRALMKKQGVMKFGDQGTATLLPSMKGGLKRWLVDRGYKGKLDTKTLRGAAGHGKLMARVVNNIDKGLPTILLFKTRDAKIDGRCVDWHYVIAVGYDLSAPKDRRLLVLDGWRDGSRADTQARAVEVPFAGCGKDITPSLLWLE